MIDVINLEKSFGDNKVLNGINITIDKGDIMVVIGPSGSGKSTFLRCLNCMEDPTGGQIIFNGVDIADPKVDINIHRRHMGMVFQHFNLYNNKTVIQNIMLAPVYVRCQDLKKAKRHNLLLPVTNLFRKEKADKAGNNNNKIRDHCRGTCKGGGTPEEDRSGGQGGCISIYSLRRSETACCHRPCACHES